MDTVRDILVLLYTACDRFSTVRATVRQWYHVARIREAERRWARQQGRESEYTPLPASAIRQQDFSRENTSRLWVRKPSRWRQEAVRNDGKGTRLTIIDGDHWWSYSPQDGVHTNEGAEHAEQTRKKAIDDLWIVELLDPSPIIPAISIEPVGQIEHAGRETIRVRALPRRLSGDPEIWPGADEYELLVDAERGVLLRSAARMDGEEYVCHEITSVTFDEPLPDELFVFSPPPGVKVHAHRPHRGLVSSLVQNLVSDLAWWKPRA